VKNAVVQKIQHCVDIISEEIILRYVQSVTQMENKNGTTAFQKENLKEKKMNKGLIGVLIYLLGGAILIGYGVLKTYKSLWSLIPFIVLILIISDWAKLKIISTGDEK